MRCVTSPTALPVHDALALAYTLSQRAELHPSHRLGPDDWSLTASSALARRDSSGLELLLRAELVPAVAEAVVLLASAVVAMSLSPDEPDEGWVLDMTVRLDDACLVVLHAVEVVDVAEQWEALVDPEPGCGARLEAGVDARVLAMASRYLHAEHRQGDVRRAISEDLDEALRELAGPAEALVAALDADALGEVQARALGETLGRAYGAGAAALAYLLALPDDDPSVDAEQAPPSVGEGPFWAMLS